MRRRQILSALPLALASPGSAGAAEPRPSLRVAVPRLPDRLDPMAAVSIAAFRALCSIFDPLVAMDDAEGQLSLRPALALAWRRVDARTLEFDLRAGVRFHDGSELTADDVAFTFGPERLTGPQPHWPAGLAFFGNLDRVEAVDRLRVRVVSRSPDPALLFRFATGTAQIVSRRAWLAAGSIDAWSRRPIGTGPFRVSGFRIDNALELAAFDDYWGGAPNAARVVFTEIREVAARVAALRGGDTDIAAELPPDQLPPIEAAPGLGVTGGPIANYLMVVMDKTNPVLADARIRRALSLAIDRQAIIDGLWGGRVDIPHGHQWAEYGPLFIPDAPAPRFDPDDA
ncbi:MAG TPA: ABC transporter substrate-binding protein, partial [Roseomonas sp.]